MARIGSLIAALLMAVVVAASEDPEYCQRPVPFTCLTPLFTADLLRKIMKLQDVNLVSISQNEDEKDFNDKLEAFDSFCKPFLESTTCNNAGIWWECSIDIAAVTELVNAVQDTINGEENNEYRLPLNKVQTYMRYAGLVCNEATGLRQVLRQRQCMIDAFNKSSDHFKTVQLHRLSDILAGHSFAGKCNQAQNGIFDLMDVIDDGCAPEIADSVFRFVSSSFTIVPGYEVEDCPINRTRSDVVLEHPASSERPSQDASSDAEADTEPEWCAEQTSPATYRCLANTLKAELLQKLNSLEGLNPILASTFSEDDFAQRIGTVNSFCEFLNASVECANAWWQCKADVESVTSLITDLQDMINGAGHEDWHLTTSWVKRYFSFADYLCSSGDLDRLQANQACVKDALATVQPNVDRLSKILASKDKFAASGCDDDKADFKAVIEAVTTNCQSAVSEFTERLLAAAFGLLDGFPIDCMLSSDDE